MFKPLTSLSQQFWIAILAGVLVFLALLFVVPSASSYHKSRKSDEHIGREIYATNHIASNIVGTVIVAPNYDAASQASGSHSSDNASDTLEFWDVKASDLALVLFTYCLVVVGWATMKSSENMLKELERARIFASVINPSLSVDSKGTSMPVGLGNHGKTTGIVEEIGVKFFATEPSGNVTNYEGGKITKLNGAASPGMDPTQPVQWYRYNSPGEFFVAGYVRYRDVFKRPWTNRFCYKVLPSTKEIQFAGSDVWSADD